VTLQRKDLERARGSRSAFAGAAETIPQFRFPLDELPLAAIVTDPSGQVVFANALAEQMLGYSNGELVGTSSSDRFPLNQLRSQPLKNGTERQDWMCIRDNDPAPLDMLVRRKSGASFPAELSLTEIMHMDKTYALVVIVDKTEKHELIRIHHQLAHLMRVSALGELAGSLAHELNQPLTAILSNAQAAQRFMAMDPINLAELRETLRDLVQDNRRASEVIRKIRTFVKKGEPESAFLDVATLLSDVALLVHSDAIVRGIRVTVSERGSLPAIQGDKVQLEQVVLNLLLNAFDATESSLKSERVVSLDVSLLPSGTIRVAVQDFGTGIAPGAIDKLFTPFFTSKRDGLGLGLSISRSIIEMHGGSIWAENNKGRGATFYFTLPLRNKPMCAPRV
jgi:two-component system, LuxR family, sensor kinase FixL